MTEPTNLDAIYELLEADDPGTRRDDQLRELVAELADAHDGCALVADLVGRWPEAVLLAGLQGDPTDKRRRGPLRAGLVGGHRMVWLSSAGWQQAGHTNRREHAPAASQLRHRYAGRNVARWIEARGAEVAERGVLLTTLDGHALREFVKEQTSSAWGAVRTGGSMADEAGRLLGGCYPDLLVIESWPTELARLRAELYPVLVGAEQADAGPGWEHEVRIAVEVELSAKTDLSGKVRTLDAAMALGWWHACVWVTDDPAVAARLRRSLTTPGGLRRGHYTAHTTDVGVDATGDRVVPTTWGWTRTTG